MANDNLPFFICRSLTMGHLQASFFPQCHKENAPLYHGCSIYFIFALFRKSVNVRQTERWRLFTDLQGTVHTARGVPVKKVAVSVQDVRRPPRHTPREQGQQITLIAWKECVFCLIVYSFPARKDYGLHWMNIGICWPLFILLVGWFGRFFIAHWI